MDELLAEFISETQETLEALAGEVIAWEANPQDRQRLDAIFRFFHTVKGSCGFLNLPRFERLSHAAEDVLSEIRDGRRAPDGATVSAVLSIMDRIGELAEAMAQGVSLPMENDAMLIDALLSAADPGVDTGKQLAVAAAPTAGEPRPAVQRTIRLPLNLIDQMMNGVSDMVLARNEMARRLRERNGDPELESAFERLSASVADMREAISKTRMQRVDRLFAAIPRMVRDIGRDLGKQIELTLEGGDVEMDREMVEMVVDPLTHIVRNSIDHGIETPEERRRAGKPERGSLNLCARQSGNQIVIEIADDGRGIDTAQLVAKAVAEGRIDAEAAQRLDEEQRLELMFAAGLSTARQVTAISGRGVGMDVVRANIERIGGVIAVDNQPGRGLKITLRVPLTLTIIPGLIVRAGAQQFAVPRAAVVEILHDNNEMLSIERIAGAGVAKIRNVRHSMIDLEDVLGIEKPVQAGPRTIMVVRAATGLPYALGVSSVENHEELVIRPAAPVVMASGVYAGMTLPDNGRPMLLLDAGGLANAARLPLIAQDERGVETAARDESGGVETVRALRFQEIGGEERLLRLSLVERVEDIPAAAFGASNGRPFVKIQERLIPVVGGVHDFGTAEVTTLRLRQGARECCYPVAQVVDIVDMPLVPDMPVGQGLIAGVAVIDDAHLEVIDAYALLAGLPDESPASDDDPLRCHIPASDAWATEILAPLLRQAGYAIAFGPPADPDPAGVWLSTDDEPEVPPGVRAHVHLRRSPRAEDGAGRSVYRYDRDAVISAVRDALKGEAA